MATSLPATPAAFADAAADEAQDGYEIMRVVKNDKPGNLRGWAIDDSPSTRPIERQAVLVPDKPFGFERGTLLSIRLKHRMLHARRNLGRFRVSITTIKDPKSIVLLLSIQKRVGVSQKPLIPGSARCTAAR